MYRIDFIKRQTIKKIHTNAAAEEQQQNTATVRWFEGTHTRIPAWKWLKLRGEKTIELQNGISFASTQRFDYEAYKYFVFVYTFFALSLWRSIYRFYSVVRFLARSVVLVVLAVDVGCLPLMLSYSFTYQYQIWAIWAVSPKHFSSSARYVHFTATNIQLK